MITVVTIGGSGKSMYYKEIMIESVSDVTDLPNWSSEDRTAPGSIAYTKDLAHTYMLDPQGTTWNEV